MPDIPQLTVSALRRAAPDRFDHEIRLPPVIWVAGLASLSRVEQAIFENSRLFHIFKDSTSNKSPCFHVYELGTVKRRLHTDVRLFIMDLKG